MKTKRKLHTPPSEVWLDMARIAIRSGLGISEFILRQEIDDRQTAREAYLAVRKEQGFVY